MGESERIGVAGHVVSSVGQFNRLHIRAFNVELKIVRSCGAVAVGVHPADSHEVFALRKFLFPDLFVAASEVSLRADFEDASDPIFAETVDGGAQFLDLDVEVVGSQALDVFLLGNELEFEVFAEFGQIVEVHDETDHQAFLSILNELLHCA